MILTTRADEDLLVELLNTTPVADGVSVDALGDVSPASTWVTDKGGVGSSAEVETLRRIRRLLQEAARGLPDVPALSHEMERIVVRPKFVDGALSWELDVPPDELLGVRALLAWATLDARAPGRLRPCANQDCRLFLMDRSNGNTARWCSMAVCGNRAKARRHYNRSRDSEL